MTTIDAATRKWIRNASDERAADRGMRVDEARGQHVLDFARNCLCLYEGDWAGQPLEPTPWQIEMAFRLFGWVKWSERHKRWIRRFRRGSIWIPKKNGKSPTLAWLGLYLLSSDGEDGQKVFFAAKDGAQAREIAGKHAIEMCLSSDYLSSCCEINKTLMQITHVPTRSILKPISSGDSRTQKSKEGLNGSVLVDEIHVVDREFMNRVSRAGISRSEPLLLGVSTAGDDPTGFGKEEYDYAKDVEAGRTDDDEYFALIYEVPQDLSDDALAADPIKYGKLANPNWGITINEAEFVADYQRSRRSMSELALFKMYRLNIWQQSASPWLRPADWNACGERYTLDDFEGQDCWVAFDLSKTRDTTAIVVVFRGDDDLPYFFPFFFLPEETAENLRDKVPYLRWAKDGYLELIDGNVVDYNTVRRKLNEIRERFNVRRLVYDATYATEMIQRMEQEDDMELGVAAPFPQTVMAFAKPTNDFENLVIEGQIRHPNSPLFNWQAGNVKVKTDDNGNKRPVKQKHGDIKTIDGVVAAIMALAAYQEGGGVDASDDTQIYFG